MKNNLQWKIVLILIVLVAAAFYLYPTVRYVMMSQEQKEAMDPQDLRTLQSQIIALGLDLQGGMHMVLQVQTDEAVTTELLRMKSDIVELFTKNKELDINTERITIIRDEIVITTSDSAAGQEARTKVLDEVGDLAHRTAPTDSDEYQLFLSMKETTINSIRERTVQQALETIRNRVDEFGVSEPIIQRQGLVGSRIMIQLPGIGDIERAKSIIGRTAQLKFHLVKDEAPTREELLAAYDGTVPDDMMILRGEGRGQQKQWFYLLEKESTVTGSDLENAFVGTDEYGLPAVDFVFKSSGAAKFKRLTSRNIGRELAIVLDDQVQSAPRIQSTISKRGQITGSFSAEEAQDLSLVLRAGALPASVVYLEERTVGPSLGRDSINKGILSTLFGLASALTFMVIYYRMSGMIANVTLVFNVIILMAAMAGLRATLTLPGIAGIILTIGMAVDANVLIFERIREELKLGKTMRASIIGGFSKATLTIIDANVTTIIAAFVLLHFGTGPVRGFAVTLSIGIAVSIFAALVVGRVIFELVQQRYQFKDMHYMQFFKDSSFDFVGKRKLFFIVSSAAIVIGMLSVLFHGGLNYGIDFSGGTLVQVKFEHPLKVQDVRSALSKIKLGDATIQKYGAEDEILIRTMARATEFNDFLDALWKKANIEDYKAAFKVTVKSANLLEISSRSVEKMTQLHGAIDALAFADIHTVFEERAVTISFVEIAREISDTLKETFTENPFEIRKVEMVGPQVGEELREAALIAMILALIGIVIYITLRFEFRFAIAAIIALVHDVLITVGIFSLLNKEFNLPIIAAILTIIGYSLNDTIVVFDRLRENLKLMRKQGIHEIINISVNQTLSRTILTSSTTLMVLVFMFFFGGEVIHDFSLALLIGIVVGTYSSIYVASPILIIWQRIAEQREARRKSLKGKVKK